MNYTRKGKSWTINECLQLQREYELLEWPINKIALKHKRTPEAIMSKIIKEEFINYEFYENLLIYKNKQEKCCESNNESNNESEINSDSDSDSDCKKNSNDKDDFNNLKNHVKNLENKLSTIIELLERQNHVKNLENQMKTLNHPTLF